ncbi:Uma2 family endonuclease [Streptomyces sp. NPDC053048]|uniref:Uma2 family endonuclease n=1 Tax=Streptomyces sp. NPDC053048 TaxID=3365694 RepID=UPI0037D1208C
MTAVDERRMTEIFENLEVPEGIRAELLRGEIVMMAAPNWVHNDIVERVQAQIPFDRWQRKTTQALDIPGEESEPQPDLVVLEREAFEAPDSLIPSPDVTMVVEVVSKTSGDRDYGVKRSIYAAGQVPAYLIIDPFAAQCLLLTDPVGTGYEAAYRAQWTTKFGDPVPIRVLDLTLDTSRFRTLER